MLRRTPVRAAWYERRGPARDTLVVGEMPDPEPGPGEVRIAVSVSGLSPGDVKKRDGWQGSPMPYPRVIPHSDGAGIIDAVGPGGAEDRVGQRVWCYGAQSYRPFGTAADYVVVPDALAVSLPPEAATGEPPWLRPLRSRPLRSRAAQRNRPGPGTWPSRAPASASPGSPATVPSSPMDRYAA